MPITPAIAWKTIQDAIYSWATTYSQISAIWGDQNAPQLAYPYLSLNVISGPTNVGIDEMRTDVATNKVEFVGNRTFTVSIMINVGQPKADTDPNNSAISIGSVLIASLRLPAVIDAFTAAGISVIESPTLQHLDLVVGDIWIARNQFDLRLLTNSNITIALDTFGYFNKVELTSTIEGADPSLNLDEDIVGPPP